MSSRRSERTGFIVHFNIKAPLALLSDAECGQLFRALIDYAESGTLPKFDGALAMAFAFVKEQMDKDREAWENTKRMRAAAGREGGLKKSANAKGSVAKCSIANSNVAKLPECDSDYDSDSECDSDYDSENKKESANALKKERGQAAPRARFVPPTLDEVAEYCSERGSSIDPAAFVDYYTANGWKQGAGKPLKDWKAAVRTWERREKEKAQRTNTARPWESHLHDDAYYELGAQIWNNIH